MPDLPVRSLQGRHEAVAAELERYRLLVESIQDYAIFLLDPEGYITSWNRGAQKNKGYTAEEIIGEHFSTFYREQDKVAGKPARELELAIRFGRIEDEDWRVRKDGSTFWANVVITALYDESRQLVGFAKVTRDLTERKQYENALREANRLLKRQHHELEQHNTYKDEFISLASHQLRTPATSIKQYLGMILEGFVGEPSPQQAAFIQKAYTSNEHQLAIVSSLLKVAQIDAGKVILRKEPTDIGQLLQDVKDNNQDTFRVRHQKSTIRLGKDLPKATIDHHYFQMVLENIIDNASKYTPDGGTINLAAKVVGKRLAVSIKDSGVGIDPADYDKLFTKFSRIPNPLSSSVSGSGLGLYWADKVISLHGGTIGVHSTQGKGTTFTVSIPLDSPNA